MGTGIGARSTRIPVPYLCPLPAGGEGGGVCADRPTGRWPHSFSRWERGVGRGGNPDGYQYVRGRVEKRG